MPADVGTRDLVLVRPDDLDRPLARHQFPLGVVAGALALVLRAGMRLRRVAVVLAMHWRWCNLDVRIASYYSARLWLLRLGLYQLSRPKIQADDWIWIVDHTMRLGERKCLILVGLRQSNWDADDRVLDQEDVELIDLAPVTESNGEVVFRQLKAAAAKTGIPRAIVSDNGPDLHGGIDRFRQKHPSTAWLYDIKHKTACLLKHALELFPADSLGELVNGVVVPHGLVSGKSVELRLDARQAGQYLRMVEVEDCILTGNVR